MKRYIVGKFIDTRFNIELLYQIRITDDETIYIDHIRNINHHIKKKLSKKLVKKYFCFKPCEENPETLKNIMYRINNAKPEGTLKLVYAYEIWT